MDALDCLKEISFFFKYGVQKLNLSKLEMMMPPLSPTVLCCRVPIGRCISRQRKYIGCKESLLL